MSLHFPHSLLNTIAQVSQEGDGSSSDDSQHLDGHWHEHVGLVIILQQHSLQCFMYCVCTPIPCVQTTNLKLLHPVSCDFFFLKFKLGYQKGKIVLTQQYMHALL